MMMRLYLGREPTGIEVREDVLVPGMFRVFWADRRPSGMVNLSRAKDTATRWAGKAGGEDALRLNWRAPGKA